MSSPTCRLSLSSGGPSQSLLQKLLDEIDNDRPPIALSRVDSLSYDPSRASSVSLPRHPTPSIWVGGNSDAEDARRKLRALDEARQRRQSAAELDRGNMSVSFDNEPMSTPSTIELPSPLSATPAKTFCLPFNHVEFNRAATWSHTDEPSPTSESPPVSMRRLL